MPTARLSKSKRFNEVFHILLEHKFIVIVKELAFYGRRKSPDVVPETVGANGTGPSPLPMRVRRLLEDLGPTFIKIGQLLGSRPDLIPVEFVDEFKKLYDQTPPTPFPDVRRLLESELGKKLEDAFDVFDPVPIASASIAQVHRARLKDGIPLAVKVQHPRIRERMRVDFEVLRTIVNFTERVFAASRVWQPADHLEEIRLMLNKELDFTYEIATQKKVIENFDGDPTVKIPEVFEELSSRRILTMEFIDGTKFRGRGQAELEKLDRPELARTIAGAMARQIFVHRLFHADPSPGNILILSSNKICFLDFGAFGHVTRRRSRLIFDLIAELGRANVEGVTRAVVELCDSPGQYDPKSFQRDVEHILDYYEIEKPSPADPVLMQKILELAKTHRMLLPADFMLITRALYQFDGLCKELDPDYELVEAVSPVVGKVARDHFLAPENQLALLRDMAQDVGTLLKGLPRHAERILSKLERGELVTQVEVKGLAEQRRHQRRLAAFAAFTALLGAFVLGGAILAASPYRQELSTYAFVALMALGLWTLVLVALGARGERG